MKLIRVIAILLLMTFSFSYANAANSTGTTNAGSTGGNSSTSTADVILGLYKSFMSPVKTFKSAVAGYGKSLIFSFVLVAVVIGGVSYAAGTKEPFELYIDAIKLSVTGTILLGFIVPQAWIGSMSGISGNATFADVITGGFDKLFNMITSSSVENIFSTFTQKIFDSIFEMMNVKLVDEQWGWMEIILNIPFILMGMMFLLITALAMLIAGALLLGEALAADLLLNIALAFAPLMIPWAMFKPASFLFSGWLKAVLIASLSLIVAALFVMGMEAFVIESISNINKAVTQKHENYSTLFSIFAPTLIGSLIIITLVSKVNGIASSLISGGGIDGIGLHAMKNAAGSVKSAGGAAAKAGSKVASAAGNGAKAAVNGVKAGANAVGNARAAMSGASQAKANGLSRAEGAQAGVKARSDRKESAQKEKTDRVQTMADKINGKSNPASGEGTPAPSAKKPPDSRIN